MQKKMLLILLSPLTLHSMQEVFDNYRQENLRFDLEQAIKANNSIKKDECYKNICSYVIAKNKSSYSSSWNQFNQKCNEEIVDYVSISAFFNTDTGLYLLSDQANSNNQYRNTINDLRKTLKEQLTGIKDHFKKQKIKNSYLCNNIVWAACALASGFAYGVVYGHNIC